MKVSWNEIEWQEYFIIKLNKNLKTKIRVNIEEEEKKQIYKEINKKLNIEEVTDEIH